MSPGKSEMFEESVRFNMVARINKKIQEMVKGCEVCIKRQDIQHQPLLSTELPEAPWLEIGSDLFEFQGESYLLGVKYYSK